MQVRNVNKTSLHYGIPAVGFALKNSLKMFILISGGLPHCLQLLYSNELFKENNL